jgi:ankyrin repeat protein
VTAKGQIALHIVAENEKYEALHLLVHFLTTNIEKGARELEYKILNHKDEDDNTILHISALSNEPQVTFYQYLEVFLKVMSRQILSSQ